MPNNKKTATLVQDPNTATLSHETATLLKENFYTLFDDFNSETMQELQNQFWKMLMYCTDATSSIDIDEVSNMLYTVKNTLNLFNTLAILNTELCITQKTQSF
jgi:hypothetical protein